MNLNQSIYKYSKKINLCPLCNKKKAKNFSKAYWNRYTDEFSDLLKIPRVNLMRLFQNKKCFECGLIYKKIWFKKKILSEVYLKKIPSHPSGWETESNNFSKKNLNSLIAKLKFYLENITSLWEEKLSYGVRKGQSEYDILVRTIKSIVKSIRINTQKQKNLQKKFTNAINKKDLVSINKDQKKIISLMTEPREFSRFKGFENEELFNFIEKKIGKIRSYGETGCPLWGMINLAKKKRCKTFFIKPENSFFWGPNCKKDGVKCLDKLSVHTKITKFSNLNKQLDYFGVYALLDHYDNLTTILHKIFLSARSVGIITEVDKRGIPIQHCTGLTEESLKFIARKFNKKLNSSFKDIRISQYRFHLYY